LDADIQITVEGAEPGDHAEKLQLAPGFAVIVKIQVVGFLDDRVGDDHVVLNQGRAPDRLEEVGHPVRALLPFDHPRGLGRQVLAVDCFDLLDQELIARPVFDRQLMLAAQHRAVADDDIPELVQPADPGTDIEFPVDPGLVEGLGGLHQLQQRPLHLLGGQFTIVGANLELLQGNRGRRLHHWPSRCPHELLCQGAGGMWTRGHGAKGRDSVSGRLGDCWRGERLRSSLLGRGSTACCPSCIG
jgi:hypothetical protein